MTDVATEDQAPGNPDLAEMLERVTQKAQHPPSGDPPPAPAPVTISAESFPGLCMGFSMLSSLTLNKIGYGALTETEGEALTAAMLKNVEAWELGMYLGNPKVCAGLDLAGVVVAIMLPRILAEHQAPRRAPVVDQVRDETPIEPSSSQSPAPAVELTDGPLADLGFGKPGVEKSAVKKVEPFFPQLKADE